MSEKIQLKLIVDKFNKPPLPNYCADNWERGLDPWHGDAAPEEFADRFPNQGERKEGWFLLDWCGNQIGFIPDGAEYQIEDAQPKEKEDE